MISDQLLISLLSGFDAKQCMKTGLKAVFWNPTWCNWIRIQKQKAKYQGSRTL